MLTGMGADHNGDCQCEFGQHVQTHKEPDLTSGMEEWSTGMICTGSEGNPQDGHQFMSLTTGKSLNHHAWTKIPITQCVIKRVEELAGDNTKKN